MKKILFGMAAAALLLNVTSCQNEDVVLQQQEETTGQEFTLQATYGKATRTTLESNGTGYDTNWSAGDQIYVTDGNGLVSGILTLTEGEGESTGTFSGIVTGNPAALQYAVFPVPANGVIDLSKVDANQVDAPMTATISGNQANFQNGCGLVRLVIYNLPENAKVTLSATGISGTLQVDGATLTQVTSADEITVKNVQSGKEFFVPVVAGESVEEKEFTLAIDGMTTKFTAKIKKGAVSVTGIPEYYVTDDGIVDMDELDAEEEGLAGSSEEVGNLIAAGKTEIKLLAGEYIMPDAKKKTLTFIGVGDPEKTVIKPQDDGNSEGDCDYCFDASTVTFNNVTIESAYTYFPGYVRMIGTYNNCVVNGVYTLYGNSKFNGCTFNVSGDIYNVWTWGALEATFTNCTFNSDGKAMLLYGTVDTKLTLNSCVFNDNGGLADLKAAVEIGNDYNRSYELIVNNTTVNGYEINDKGINTGTTLWGNKNSMSKEKLNVVVDGVDVY